jgi:hypothetical protein
MTAFQSLNLCGEITSEREPHLELLVLQDLLDCDIFRIFGGANKSSLENDAERSVPNNFAISVRYLLLLSSLPIRSNDLDNSVRIVDRCEYNANEAEAQPAVRNWRSYFSRNVREILTPLMGPCVAIREGEVVSRGNYSCVWVKGEQSGRGSLAKEELDA